MEGYSGSIAILDRPEVSCCRTENPPSAAPTAVLNVSLLGRLLLFAGSIVEYAFGAHIGFAACWVAGFLLGDTYVEYLKPAYMNDLGQLSYWELLPYRFAKDCAIFGIVAGIIIIAIVKNKLLRHNIVSLYEKGVSEPRSIARRLGRSEEQIQRVIKKFALQKRKC